MFPILYIFVLFLRIFYNYFEYPGQYEDLFYLCNYSFVLYPVFLSLFLNSSSHAHLFPSFVFILFSLSLFLFLWIALFLLFCLFHSFFLFLLSFVFVFHSLFLFSCIYRLISLSPFLYFLFLSSCLYLLTFHSLFRSVIFSFFALTLVDRLFLHNFLPLTWPVLDTQHISQRIQQ